MAKKIDGKEVYLVRKARQYPRVWFSSVVDIAILASLTEKFAIILEYGKRSRRSLEEWIVCNTENEANVAVCEQRQIAINWLKSELAEIEAVSTITFYKINPEIFKINKKIKL